MQHGQRAREQSNSVGGHWRSSFEKVWQQHYRAEASLMRRCKAGDLDALTALAYALADDLWTAACLRRADVAPARASGETRLADGPAMSDAAEVDPTGLVDAAAEALTFALRKLEGWSTPSLAQLRAAALARLGVVATEVEQMQVAAPAEVVVRLAQVARGRAAALTEASRRRSFWRLQGYAVIGALVLSLGVMLASYQAISRIGRVPPVLLETLQFRVRHSGLPTALRDLAWELPDPTGLDRPLATTLEETALLLDEIAALSPVRAPEQLPFMAVRIARRGLTDALQAAAGQEVAPKTDLLDACLVLQEVENCFGPGGAQ